MTRVLLALLSLVAASPVLGQWNDNGEAVPDTAWRKSSGKFGVMLLLSDNPEQFMADWEKPEPPNVTTTEVAQRGKPIVAFVIFVGCREVAGKCNSIADFVVLRPDGSEYTAEKGAELWRDKPAPAENHLQLSIANLGIVIEPNDPAGKYRVQVVARDLNAMQTISVEQTFVVER